MRIAMKYPGIYYEIGMKYPGIYYEDRNEISQAFI